jgi:hypothetical protein
VVVAKLFAARLVRGKIGDFEVRVAGCCCSASESEHRNRLHNGTCRKLTMVDEMQDKKKQRKRFLLVVLLTTAARESESAALELSRTAYR